MIRIKRVFAPPDGSDGVRILVDRLRPRGVTREAARIDEWRKDLAPTTVLRKWCEHDPSKWRTFGASCTRRRPRGGAGRAGGAGGEEKKREEGGGGMVFLPRVGGGVFLLPPPPPRARFRDGV